MRKIIGLFLIFTPFFVHAQKQGLSKGFESERVFVKNEGQYDGMNWQEVNKPEYVVKEANYFTFFTKKGITYRIESLIRNPNRDKNNPESPKRVHTSELIDVFWIGANENVEIISENPTDFYYSFAIKNPKSGEVSNLNNVKGYKKITYKNLYDKIDIEYLIHPEAGVKYNVILHPGADPSKIKFKYITSHTNHAGENISISLNQSSQIEINASKGQIIEHKPVSFYENSGLNITSSYVFSNNILSFNLGNYDNTQKVIIDPWVVSPAFNAGDFTREVETDAAGNIYVIGGEIPMELRKYNSLGVLQWTYATPWDTNGGDWLGTLATDNLGNSFITQGTGAEIERVNTIGGMVWHANNNTFSPEYWSITFNCDKTKLIVGGTKLSGLLPPLTAYATIFDIDINSGSVLSEAVVNSNTVGGIGDFPIEVRSISSSKNAKYLYLTHTQVGAVNQDIGACGSSTDPSFSVSNTGKLAYKCENYLSSSQNGGGLKAIVANDNFFYTHKGNQVLQWNVNTGVLINTVALPGGSSGTVLGDLVVHCSGLAVDNAGNVYAGSMDRVVKFDQNLNILSQANTTGGFTVYDVSVNNNGEVIAVGAIQNNSVSTGRGGRIESLNMTASAQYALVCCDANFCEIDPLCPTDPSVTFAPNTPGGTWSSSPATSGLNSSTGVFNPSIAGPGTYTIAYSLACGSNSIEVIVSSCAALTVCEEANGDLSVTGGAGPYTWANWQSTTVTPTTQTACTTCGGSWNPGLPPIVPASCSVASCSVFAYVNFATGVIVTPPGGATQIQVTDNLGNVLEITDIPGLPSCSASCDATITQAGPFCSNASSVNLTAAETGGTWSGTGITNASTGTFNPATAGAGSHVITYNLTCGDTDTMTIVVNAIQSAAFTYPSGSYCLSDPNPTPTITGVSGGTFTINNSGVINASTGVIDLNSSGVGSYTVTYTTAGTCPGTATFNITITNATDATITQVGPYCSNAASVNLTAVSPGGTWTGTGITNGTTGTFNPATAGVGGHVITYTISGSCGSVDTMTIVVNAAQSAAFTYASGSFCLTDPNPTPTITGATGGTFTINNSGVINSSTGVINITGSGAGSFVVTYTTAGPCPASQTFNVTINSCTAPLPVANFSASQTNICIGDCISFTDLSNSSATGGITAWSWTFTGATPSTFNAQTPTNICYNTAGTYQVVLTVTDANGVDTETKTAYITVASCTTPITNFSVSDSTICSGSCVNFTDLSTGATSWQWSFQNGTPPTSSAQNPTNICFDVSGTHEIKLVTSNAFGSDSLIKYVTVFQTQQVFVGNDTTIQLGQSVNLNATGLSSNGVYYWTPPIDLSCITCPNPISTPEETITYTVITTDSNGCKSTDNINIIVLFENVIFVPNIFSPNGDGINDILFVRGKGVEKLKFFIYDRWGEKVFETTSLDVGWDGSFRGKDMNKAVFVYYLEATFIDGQEVT
ncbi:MAG: gliding motility-associated C-terminal domain-containing protein, partial [Flavobacteriales bacterium]|nr:gliding motility-associated C-terminal domain-containing protein [Flavobacteriales bacterium]